MWKTWGRTERSEGADEGARLLDKGGLQNEMETSEGFVSKAGYFKQKVKLGGFD